MFYTHRQHEAEVKALLISTLIDATYVLMSNITFKKLQCMLAIENTKHKSKGKYFPQLLFFHKGALKTSMYYCNALSS